MRRTDWRDWAVLALVAGMEVASIIYLFAHPSDTMFAAWASLCGTVTAAYHYLVQRDDKVPDQC